MVSQNTARTAQRAAREVGASGAARAQAMGRQGIDAITDMASQARDAVSDASDSVIAYTKKNPVKALVIAGAFGALLYAVLKTLTPSDD
jgi:cobalamin biosynthesis protein CbiD